MINPFCILFGHRLEYRVIWLGDPGYRTVVNACKRRLCDHMESVRTKENDKG